MTTYRPHEAMIRALIRHSARLTSSAPKLKYQKCEFSNYRSGSSAGISNTITCNNGKNSLAFSSSGEVVAATSNSYVRSNCGESKSFGLNLKFNQNLPGKTFVRTFTSSQRFNSSTSEKKIVKKRMVRHFTQR